MTDFFIINIANEVVLEAKNISVECNQNFIVYYIKLLLLDPMWKMYPGMEEINRVDVLRIVNYILKKMKFQHCPCMLSLKTHMYFTCNFQIKDKIVSQYRINLKNRIEPLENEILESKPIDAEAIEYFKKQIIYYITLLKGIGNPTNSHIYREASQAFRSVYDEEDVEALIMAPKPEKRIELADLANIITGIRLFNRKMKRGGQDIEDVPALVRQGIIASYSNIETILANIMDTINLITSAIDQCFKVKEKDDGGYYVICEIASGIDYEDIEYAKDLLIVYRQYEVFLRKMLETLNLSDICVNNDIQQFKATQTHLKQTVYLKIAVHTEIVFPLFEQLAYLWGRMQDEIIYTTNINQIVYNLQLYLHDLVFSEPVLMTLLGNGSIETDAERHKRTIKETIPQEDNLTTIFLPEHTKGFYNIHVEFLGFCAWKIVAMQGGLIPANPNLGLSHYNGKYYAFSCLEAAKEFGKSPQTYINETLQLCRKKPELISFFELERELSALRFENLIQDEGIVESKISHEVQIQTELHPIPSNIDPEYTWNTWELKRQAVQLADMSTMATKSVQTTKSNCRNDVRTQTTNKREVMSQTKSDNYTNTPTLSSFLYGLRGRKDDNQFTIDLTRPVDEK